MTRNKLITAQLAGFILIAVVSVSNELLTSKEVSHALTELGITILVAAISIYITARITRHFDYIISFIKLCSRCGRIRVNDKWVEIDPRIKEKLKNIDPSHGICIDCYNKGKL